MSNYRHEKFKEIINAAYTVHNSLGYGFLEKIYQKTLIIGLRNRGIAVGSEKELQVKYAGELVGHFFVDIVVDNKVILKIKAVESHIPVF